MTPSQNAREALDSANAGIVAAMNERENDPFAEIIVRIIKAKGMFSAVEVETKRRTNLGKG